MLEGLHEIFNGKYSHILIIGIGNYLRSDDGAGPRIVEKLTSSEKVRLLNTETNIERYIEPIQNSPADVLLFIDCVHFGKEPGYTELIPIETITDHTFHSHNISMNRIREFFTVPAFVLGIEPGSLKVGEKLTTAVKQKVDDIILLLNALIAVP